jgi:peptidoglycan LD-endopeptidase CwlK
MPNFSKESLDILATCNPILQNLFKEVIKHFDCKVLYGYRTPQEQLELFKKGRSLVNGAWVVTNQKLVVTDKDGTIKKSNHNFNPSIAVDVVPYPVDWKNTKRFYYFAGFVKGIAATMNYKIVSGGDWDNDTDLDDQKLYDLPHFEIKIL